MYVICIRNSRYHITVCRLFVLDRNIWYHFIFTNTFARAGYDTRSIFKRSLTGLISEFSFSQTHCHTKAEEPSLPYYLPIAGERIIGFIPFPRVLVLCEMQSVSSRIWTRVTVSISYDYTTAPLVIWYHNTVSMLFVFDKNIWYHITVCKLFFYKNIWYHITVGRLFVLDRNIWYHITVCMLFVFDKNIWYQINMCKLLVLDLLYNSVQTPLMKQRRYNSITSRNKITRDVFTCRLNQSIFWLLFFAYQPCYLTVEKFFKCREGCKKKSGLFYACDTCLPAMLNDG